MSETDPTALETSAQDAAGIGAALLLGDLHEAVAEAAAQLASLASATSPTVPALPSQAARPQAFEPAGKPAPDGLSAPAASPAPRPALPASGEGARDRPQAYLDAAAPLLATAPPPLMPLSDRPGAGALPNPAAWPSAASPSATSPLENAPASGGSDPAPWPATSAPQSAVSASVPLRQSPGPVFVPVPMAGAAPANTGWANAPAPDAAAPMTAGWLAGSRGVDAAPAAPVAAGASGAAAGSAAPLSRQSSGPTGGDVFLDGTRVGRWLSDTLAREAGGPATGGTGFDPRLGPTWPGALQGNGG